MKLDDGDDDPFSMMAFANEAWRRNIIHNSGGCYEHDIKNMTF